jgi:putative flippase GtrA
MTNKMGRINLKELLKKARQVLSFSLVGVMNTLVDMAVFALLHGAFSMDPALSQGISYSCGVLNSYIMNRVFTFRVKKKAGVLEAVRFVAVNLVSLGLSVGVLYLVENYTSINIYAAKAGITLLTMVVNYLGFKLFVFKSGDKG